MIIIDANVALEYRSLPIFHHKSELALTGPVFEEIIGLSKSEKEPILSELIKGIKIIETKERFADDSIVEAAKKSRCSVATFDKVLIRKLKKEGIDVIISKGEIIRAVCG
jgi:rRNA-processing protein FCF1